MIHVDRRSVKPPSALRDKLAQRARGQAEEWFRRDPAERRQLTFAFDPAVYAGQQVRAALTQLFQGKCAFCESSLLGETTMEVVQLRPPQNTLDLDGALAGDHYWWLAYAWENLYASCSACARLRGTRFPVAGARLDPPPAGHGEEPLLLDPCEDEPEQHFLYLGDGTVVSDTERGRVTCDVFGLNRAQLVDARRETVAEVSAELEALEERTPEALEPLIATARQYAGLRRQRVAELLGNPPEVPTEVRVERPQVKGRVREEFTRIQSEHEGYSLDAPGKHVAYYAHARHIERIELRNFRAVERLDLQLDLRGATSSDPRGAPSPDPRAPWLMLLGENGLGKTTTLQAAALALLDERGRERLGLDAREFVRNGARRGSVTIHLSGGSAPIELVARKTSRHFEGSGGLKSLLLGYGATRLLPTPAHPVSGQDDPALARVDNLFDPFVPVGDATAWLLGLSEERFDEVARGLRSLLMLGPEERLVRDRRHGRVLAEEDGVRVRLESLSAGYQSVIALATDVMKTVLRLWESATVAEGVVIVDELGAHLHPRWRMRIVEALRQVFPRVQFLTSTHDPLCLRGLADGEIVVLRQDSEGRIVALDDLPPAASMRIDQLLGSEHFGLGSTVDPDLDGLFAEYYALKARARPSARERTRLEQLHGALDGRRLLGTTRRERLIYEATDQYLAQEVDVTGHDERTALRQATKDKILAAWKGSA
jgi:uncharacterized protein (TIGR02646 family)